MYNKLIEAWTQETKAVLYLIQLSSTIVYQLLDAVFTAQLITLAKKRHLRWM